VVDALAVIRRHGGLAATHELYAAGFDRHSLAASVRRREVVRVRQGWFCAPGTDPELRRAARVGGRATCRTALRLSGLWTEADPRLHVAVDAHAVRLRTAQSPLHRRRDVGDATTTVHWRDAEKGRNRLMVTPVDAFADLAHCATADEIAAAADSLLHRDVAARVALADIASRLPSAARRAILDADGVCESGIETILWRRLRRQGITARRQVRIPGIGRVDFVIGRHLVLEVDGEAYHTDPLAFESDRRRDAALSIAGFRVLRFSYDQVRSRPDEVDRAILASIARGDSDE
jgi:very-short-patch-repair endonuclease